MEGLSSCFVDGVAGVECIEPLIGAVVRAFLIFSGVVTLFLVVWGALKLITSGGDAKQVAAARQIITYAIIGVVVVLSSFSIVYFIGYVTKTENCITDPGKIQDGGCP